MNIYTSLQNSVYDSLATLFPNTTIVQAYTNGPEPKSPYIVFDLYSVKQQGQEYVETYVTPDGLQQIYSHYSCLIRLEFAAPTQDFRAAELANEMYFKVDYTTSQEVFLRNNLSYLRKSSIRKIPKKRDTDWWMFYQIDLHFGYQVEARQNTGVIESVEIKGEYLREDGTPLLTQNRIP